MVPPYASLAHCFLAGFICRRKSGQVVEGGDSLHAGKSTKPHGQHYQRQTSDLKASALTPPLGPLPASETSAGSVHYSGLKPKWGGINTTTALLKNGRLETERESW